MSQQPSSTSTATKGIGPHFKDDAIALIAAYQAHAITHDELREGLAQIGAPIKAWPDGTPKPILFKFWMGIEEDLDDPDQDALVLYPPPPLPELTEPEKDRFAIDLAEVASMGDES